MVVALSVLGMMLLQQAGFDFDSIWQQMGWLARGIVIVFSVLLAWCVGAVIDRWLTRR